MIIYHLLNAGTLELWLNQWTMPVPLNYLQTPDNTMGFHAVGIFANYSWMIMICKPFLPPPRNWKRPPWTLSLFSHPPSENIFARSSLAQLYSMQNKEKKINMDRKVNSQQSGAAITELFISLSRAPVTKRKRKLFGKLVCPMNGQTWDSLFLRLQLFLEEVAALPLETFRPEPDFKVQT